MADQTLEAGQRWELSCPFFKQELGDYDDRSWRWVPGMYTEDPEYEKIEIGKEARTIVAVIDLPPPYHQRIFYSRSWVAPDGYEFGKPQLRCIAVRAFNAWRRNGPSWNRLSEIAELVGRGKRDAL